MSGVTHQGQRGPLQDPGQGWITMATVLTIGGEMGVACILFAMIMQRETHTRISITSVLSFPKSQVNPKKFPVCTHPPTYPPTHTHTHIHSWTKLMKSYVNKRKSCYLATPTLWFWPAHQGLVLLCFCVFMTHWGCMAK